MLDRLKPLWESIATSLWFVPALFTTGAMAFAALAVTLPANRETDPDVAGWIYSGSATHAATLLSSLLTAMITMATLAVSITMVVLALAAGQLGPRLIRSFMADKRTQLMLGLLLATIVYLLLILRLVGEGTREDDVPHLAVTAGTGLVIICVFVLLFFVHHLGRSIVADTVIQRVGRDLDLAVQQMLPEPGAETVTPPRPAAADRPGAPLTLPNGGYVQVVNYSSLVACARKADALITLDFRPGQHLLPHTRHGCIHPGSALDEAMLGHIGDAVVLGNQRTAAQDLEFAIRQLVEVSLRAQSTGINEPFTSIAVIDRLGISLAHVMRRGMASGMWCDEDGILRVTGSTTTFRGIVDAAFNQIRQSGAGHPDVLIRIQATLAKLAELVRHDEHREVIADHVELIAAAGKASIQERYDQAALEERTSAARAQLSRHRSDQARTGSSQRSMRA